MNPLTLHALTGERTTHHSMLGCRNCRNRYKGADNRRRCRNGGHIAKLTHDAEKICRGFDLDERRGE